MVARRTAVAAAAAGAVRAISSLGVRVLGPVPGDRAAVVVVRGIGGKVRKRPLGFWFGQFHRALEILGADFRDISTR